MDRKASRARADAPLAVRPQEGAGQGPEKCECVFISARQAVVVLLCTLAVLFWAGSGDVIAARWQFWPEASWHFPINEDTQLSLVARITQDQGTLEQDLQLGPSVRFDLDTSQNSDAQTAEERDRTYLTLGVGYRYIYSRGDRDDPFREHRGIIALTPRWYLPYSLIVSDRNRLDLRWIEGEGYSTRYRNRLTVERQLRVRRRDFTAYVEAEAFNDFRYGGWERYRYGLGVRFHMPGLLIRQGVVRGRGTMLDVYLLHQDDRRRPNNTFNVIGVAYKLYH
jgi:hypothetical protein